MNTNNSLDDIILAEGQEFNEKEHQLITNANINNHELPYDDYGPLPGAKTEVISDDINMNEAEDKILAMEAVMKLQNEQEQYRKMSDNEKIKDYVLQSQYYYQTNEWFKKYGYEMTGKQKRVLKRDIERAWKKGKFKLTDEQKENILFELGKASNERKQLIENGQQNQQPQTKASAEQHIADLNQLIFK
ncbi:MAG: hypothetical protein [Wendovervirus sonii]|uniref:Uncharacterized protein n=1 Tax=phage Lak_Megaphage_Sonny TaxID=3109229 RepID=A0ABZ0Z498_9CAUD|nr:MAG: hypothetical protein [phage Lak_Megaphage_Sonny]